MKKTFMILGAAMLALAVVGCENEPIDEGNTPAIPEEPSTEEPAEPADPTEPTELVLRATLPSTRTILNSDYTVSWANSDQLAVFNAPTGTTVYSENLRFKVTDTTTGAFGAYDEDVVVPFEEGVNYDWYVLMPWRSTGGKAEMLSPKGQSAEDGYFPIGAQTQTGYNNSTHVSSQDVMVGKVTNTRTPEVALKHLAVLHKFTVTNNSNATTVIEKLTLNGGENKIFGTFWIDLTSDEPEIDINKANATFNERALTVKNGTELAVGESADFYMITAPFTLNAGETFKITIETTTGTQTLEKTTAKDLEFAAGTYNTANLVYDYQIEFADHLYSDTFNGTFNGSDKVDSANTTFTPARWDTYDKGGMTVYDGVISNVNYVHDANSTLSRQAATVIVGMDDLFVWFKSGGVLTVNGIKLHGKTDLTLSFNQTYKSSGITTEYSVDGGTTWNQIGVSAHPAGNSMATYSYNFSVPADSETISLRFTATTSTPRMDNVKLTWQE